MLNKNFSDLIKTATVNREKYKNNAPFPNISFEDFFDNEFLEKVLSEFPDLSSKASVKFDNPNENKLASKAENLMGEYTKKLIHFVNSQPFLDFLSELTGIRNLIPDPYLVGGGYHESKRGGFLKIHADFNKHPQNNLDRRLNLLIYLNKDWEDSYGGHFELWDKDMKDCIKKIRPDFNRIALFSTTSHSFHGLPNPLECPKDKSRKSIALYYYTNGRPKNEVDDFKKMHGTIFKAREEDANMQKYNSIKNFIENISPPFIYKTIKKLRNKS